MGLSLALTIAIIHEVFGCNAPSIAHARTPLNSGRDPDYLALGPGNIFNMDDNESQSGCPLDTSLALKIISACLISMSTLMHIFSDSILLMYKSRKVDPLARALISGVLAVTLPVS
jgi:hypothetical protein